MRELTRGDKVRQGREDPQGREQCGRFSDDWASPWVLAVRMIARTRKKENREELGGKHFLDSGCQLYRYALFGPITV